METPAPAQAEPAAQANSASVSPAAPAAPAAIPSVTDLLASPLDITDAMSNRAFQDAMFARDEVNEPTPAPAAPIETPSSVQPVPEEVKPPAGDPPPETAPVPETVEPPAEVETEPVTDVVTGIPIQGQPKRIRLTSFADIDQRAIALQGDLKKQGIDIDLGEASARVKALLSPNEPEAAPEVQSVAIRPTVRPEIAALEAKAAELKAKIVAAGDEGSLFNSEIAAANLEYAETRAEIVAARAEANAEARSQQSRSNDSIVAARQANVDQVIQRFPAADDARTILGSHVAAKIAQIQADPNHAEAHLLAGADAPSKIASVCVSELTGQYKAAGLDSATISRLLGEKSAPAIAPASQTKTAVQKNALVSAPGSASAPASAPAFNSEKLLQDSMANPSLLFSNDVAAAIFGSDPAGKLRFG